MLLRGDPNCPLSPQCFPALLTTAHRACRTIFAMCHHRYAPAPVKRNTRGNSRELFGPWCQMTAAPHSRCGPIQSRADLFCSSQYATASAFPEQPCRGMTTATAVDLACARCRDRRCYVLFHCSSRQHSAQWMYREVYALCPLLAGR